MAESGFLTTKSTEWSRGRSLPPLWKTDDTLHKDFGENEELPLDHIQSIAPLSVGGVMEKRRTEGGMLVAVKTMNTYGNWDTNDDLKREVAILRSLNHYHSVSLLGTYTKGDSFSAVMEPCATCDLYTYLSKPKSKAFKNMTMSYGSPDSFLPKIMGCLAHGLQYIHKVPKMQYGPGEGKVVRHRDITLTNIVLDGPRVLYTDFGLSKFVTATQTGSTGSSSKTKMVKATPSPRGFQHANCT